MRGSVLSDMSMFTSLLPLQHVLHPCNTNTIELHCCCTWVVHLYMLFVHHIVCTSLFVHHCFYMLFVHHFNFSVLFLPSCTEFQLMFTPWCASFCIAILSVVVLSLAVQYATLSTCYTLVHNSIPCSNVTMQCNLVVLYHWYSWMVDTMQCFNWM